MKTSMEIIGYLIKKQEEAQEKIDKLMEDYINEINSNKS